MGGKTAKAIRKKIKQYDQRIRKEAIDDFIIFARNRPFRERLRFCRRILFR